MVCNRCAFRGSRRCNVGRQLRVCRRCDCGQRYCSATCQQQGRRSSLARANARYQHSPRGARHHAVRQARWCARQHEKVTYHRLALRTMTEKVRSVVFSERIDDDIVDEAHLGGATTSATDLWAVLSVWGHCGAAHTSTGGLVQGAHGDLVGDGSGRDSGCRIHKFVQDRRVPHQSTDSWPFSRNRF